MLKPLHQLSGTLTASLASGALIAYVDSASFTLLYNVLDGTNWTYLAISSGTDYEIVKATDISGTGVVIERAVDGTSGLDFASGAFVAFVLTESAVADIVTAVQLSGVAIEGAGAVEVTDNGGGSFTVDAPEVAITGSGGVIVSGTHEDGFVIEIPESSACCD